MLRVRHEVLTRTCTAVVALLCLLGLAAVPLAATPAAASAEGEGDAVVDVPVSFTVTNVNRSKAACPADGRTYTVRGHLTGPASELTDADRPSGALYLHGLELGEWFWRMPVIGDGYARSMAARGHVSVTIDRLGYNSSGQPSGLKSCVGSQADVAHQIVQQLRSGAYDGEVHPGFDKVALIGHSLGGSIAQAEAYSFGDVDAVGVLSYADVAMTPSVLATALTWTPQCLLGGATSEAGSPGYAHLTRNTADFQKNFLAHTPAAAVPAATAAWDLNPCGDLLSAVPAAAMNLLGITKIDVPVLELVGDRDLVFDDARVRLEAQLFLGSPSVTLRVVPGATHGLTLEPTATEVIDEIDRWLRQESID